MKPNELERAARRAETDRALRVLARRVALRLDQIADKASHEDEVPAR